VLLHRRSPALLHLLFRAKAMVKHAAHKQKKRPLALSTTTGIGTALKKMGKTGAAATKGALDAFVKPMTRFVAPPSLPPVPEKPKPKPAVAAASHKPPTPAPSSSTSATAANTMPRFAGPPPPSVSQKSKPAAVAAAATKPPTPTPSSNTTTATTDLSTDWLVERLHGGHGRADAQASWDARRTEKLSATDVALFNKRRMMAKARQPGWRVQGDKRIFVAYTGAGMQVAEGAEAFKLSMVFGKGKGKGEGWGGGGGGEAGKGKKKGKFNKEN